MSDYSQISNDKIGKRTGKRKNIKKSTAFREDKKRSFFRKNEIERKSGETGPYIATHGPGYGSVRKHNPGLIQGPLLQGTAPLDLADALYRRPGRTVQGKGNHGVDRKLTMGLQPYTGSTQINSSCLVITKRYGVSTFLQLGKLKWKTAGNPYMTPPVGRSSVTAVGDFALTAVDYLAKAVLTLNRISGLQLKLRTEGVIARSTIGVNMLRNR